MQIGTSKMANIDEDDYEGATYLTQAACNESSEMFLDAVTGRLGGAIGEQARSICNDGEPLNEQNGNALKYIADYANKHGLSTIASEITSYLSSYK